MQTTAPLAGSESDRERVAAELRIGRIDFLNMYPMHWALGIEPAASGAPTDVNRAIVNGEIDVACMSSIEYARHADELMLLPSMCVSAEGAVGSIFVISTDSFESIRDIWVTPHSATSVVLMQLLAKLRGSAPTIHLLDAPINDVLSGGSNRAVLVIGDEALRARGDSMLARYVFEDLGERWLA